MRFAWPRTIFRRRHIKNWSPPAARPRLLLLSSAKRNQNYYRDQEIVRRYPTVWITEDFPFARTGYHLGELISHTFGAAAPELVLLHYSREYTSRLTGWEAVTAPIVAFVGDAQDFILPEEVCRRKAEFFQRLRPRVWVTAYPRANHLVRQGLQDYETPILTCYWGIPPAIFRPLHQRRQYDIGCLGSHTPRTYPFRNQVRDYLLQQRRLRFFKQLRVGGHDGVVFARTLNRLRACFTDASIYGYTLMKYFEIPACGTLLFAEATPDLPDLGFQDGQHYVAVDRDNFRDKIEYYLLEAPAEETARIARQGQELVHRRHSWAQRLDDLFGQLRDILGSDQTQDVLPEN